MNQNDLEYKFLLSNDLVVYLMYLLSKNADNKEEIIREILNDWSSRLEFQKNIMERKLALKTSEENPELPSDVAEILISAHNIEKTMLKGEYKSQIRKVILESIKAASKNKDNLERQMDKALKKN